jgi:hypothetical protein
LNVTTHTHTHAHAHAHKKHGKRSLTKVFNLIIWPKPSQKAPAPQVATGMGL